MAQKRSTYKHQGEVIWKPVTSHDGIFKNHYHVSNSGEVKTVKTGKIRKPRKDKDGYRIMDLKIPGVHKTVRVHKVAAEAFFGPPKPGQTIVNHKSGNKWNTHIDDLEWVTASENVLHGYGLPGNYEKIRKHTRIINGKKVVVKQHIREKPHEHKSLSTGKKGYLAHKKQ